MVTVKSSLEEVLSSLPDERLREVLDFARRLSAEEDHAQLQELGREAFASGYGPDEPEYTEADIKVRYTP